METQLKIIGSLMIVLSFIHFAFPKYFHWKEELRNISLINRQMMVIHTFFIALVVFLMGLLCLTSASQLLFTELGSKLTFGLALFWTLRLFVQFFGYSENLWKGKSFETLVHIIFSLLWIYFSVILWVGFVDYLL